MYTMMDGKSSSSSGDHADKGGFDDFMMPGFRFHPTDEELVGFYLKRKLQLRPLPVDLIKQVDIYKYDPWDLPKLAPTGEKEWYFYCPRDRKYRNSTRPNRVTGSGFWKATGTDRPIYSSDGTKCIGLKKSLVFYKGRAAKGFKTDWMMHEFRLPSTTDNGAQAPATAKKILHKNNLPPTDSWAICRIFKKANSMANRALLPQSWQAVSSSPSLDGYYNTTYDHRNHFVNSEMIHSFQANFSDLNIPAPFKAIASVSDKPSILTTSSNNDCFPENVAFSEVSGTNTKSAPADHLTSLLFNQTPVAGLAALDACKTTESIPLTGCSVNSPNTMPASVDMENEVDALRKNQAATTSYMHNQWGGISNIRSMGLLPFSLPSTVQDSWDSPPPCPSEISSSNHSTNKCYT